MASATGVQVRGVSRGGLAPLVYAPAVVDGMRVVAHDPAGPGRVVEVLGDLDAADHVAILVPGNAHDLGTYATYDGGASPRANGHTLWHALRQAQAQAEDESEVRAAVLVWLGYACPRGVVAGLRPTAARAGAEDLRALTTWLPSSAHITLIGHSYGAVVCAAAVPAGRVDDLVALASPGFGAVHPATLTRDTRLWAARARRDWVRFVPPVRLGGFGHGRHPTSRRVPATLFATDGASGHSSYYMPGSESLRNIVRIVLGRHDEVTPAGPAPTTAHVGAYDAAANEIHRCGGAELGHRVHT